MILVSERGIIREVLTPFDEKVVSAGADFRRDVEAQFFGHEHRRHRKVIVPVGALHSEPRPPVRYSRGINEQLAGAAS